MHLLGKNLSAFIRLFSLNFLAEMAGRGIKAKVPDVHRERRLFVVTAGENPQLEFLI